MSKYEQLDSETDAFLSQFPESTEDGDKEFDAFMALIDSMLAIDVVVDTEFLNSLED